MITIVAYPARTGTSKAGKAYASQQLEVVQSPARPNVTLRRWLKADASDALAPGSYTASLRFRIAQVADGDGRTREVLVATPVDFVPVKAGK